MASRYKKDYKFDFAKAVKFFIVNIDGSIDKNKLAEQKNLSITFNARCNNYPYNADLMKLITNTFHDRGYQITMKGYKLNLEDDAKFKYEYKFLIEHLS
jgi:hypothetical protein